MLAEGGEVIERRIRTEPERFDAVLGTRPRGRIVIEARAVPRSAAMKMVDHKTEAIYRRYAIADENMLREGAAKLKALLERSAAPSVWWSR